MRLDITFHLINAFPMVPDIGGTGYKYSCYLKVSAAVHSIFSRKDLWSKVARTGFEFFYWIYILAIRDFLMRPEALIITKAEVDRITTLLAERAPAYARFRQVVTDDRTIDELVDESVALAT